MDPALLMPIIDTRVATTTASRPQEEQQQQQQQSPPSTPTASSGHRRRQSARQQELLRKRRAQEAEAQQEEEETEAAGAPTAWTLPWSLPPLPRELRNLPLMHWPLWTEHVLECLAPRDLCALGLVSRAYRLLHVGDDIWRPLAAQVYDGDYLAELDKAQALGFLEPGSPHRKSCFDAYRAATTHRCPDCCGQAWAYHVNALTLRPQCWRCFAAWAAAGGLMIKGKAAAQYLLNAAEAGSLPCVMVGPKGSGLLTNPAAAAAAAAASRSADDLASVASATSSSTTTPRSCHAFVSRDHAEALALRRWDSLAGLLAEKARRKAKAEARRQRALAEHAARAAAAASRGQPPPPPPRRSALLDAAIDRSDNGVAAGDDELRHHVLVAAGFSHRDAPTRPLCPGDLGCPTESIVCKFCRRNGPARPPKSVERYPSYKALGDEHLHTCQYVPTDFWESVHLQVGSV